MDIVDPFKTQQSEGAEADTGIIDPFKSATAMPPKQEDGQGWFSRAISNMHEEGSKSFGESVEGVKKLNPMDPNRVGANPLEQIKDVGSGLASLVGAPFSYPMGAARSLIGHPMAAAGEWLDKKTGGNRTEQEIFDEMSPGIDTALGAVARKPRSLTDLQGPGLSRFVTPTKEVTPGRGSLMTEKGQELRAGHVLREAADDPEKLAQSLDNPPPDIVPGSKPTTFQATGDMGVGRLEDAARTRDSQDFATRRGEQNSARVDALENAQRTGSPEAVADFIRSDMASANARMDGAIEQARHRAWQETHGLGGHGDPQLYGNIIRRELNMAEEAARAEERELWNRVDPNGDLVARTGPVQQAHNRVYGNLTEAAQTTLTEKERQLNGVIEGYGPSVPFREMTDLRSAVSAAMREERMANGRSPAYGRLSRLRGDIETAIANDVMDINTRQFTTAAAERLRLASEATRNRAQTFNQKPIKEVLRRDGLEGQYSMQEGAVYNKLSAPGPVGYDNATAFIRSVGPQEALPVLRDVATASMRRAATDASGAIDARKLSQWRASHQDLLRAIEEVDGGNFARTIDNADNAVRSVGEVAASRAQVLERFEDQALQKLLNTTDAKDISRTLGGIFTGERSVGRAREVARALRSSPEAMDGARRGIAEYVMERFISNTEAATSGQNLIRADQFQTFMRKNKTALLQFFSPEQLASWQAIADDIHRANRSIVATKIPGRSNTPQDLYALKIGPQKTSALYRAAASAGAGLAGSAAGMPWLGAVGSALGVNFLMGLREAGVTSVQGVVRKALLDPAFAKDLLQRASPQMKMRGIKRYSMYQANNAGGVKEDK